MIMKKAVGEEGLWLWLWACECARGFHFTRIYILNKKVGKASLDHTAFLLRYFLFPT